MATAVYDTVSQYIPTFEKVEPYTTSLDGAGTEEMGLGHSLVLTQPDNMSTISSVSSSSQRSSKSDKMQKKLDYETGVKQNKSNKRILRSISKTFRSSSNNKEQPQISSPKPRPVRTLSRTISQHELNLDSKASALKKSANLKSSNNIRVPTERKNSTANLRGSTNLKSSNNLRVPTERKNSNPNIRRSSALSKNVAELNKTVAELANTRSSELRFSQSMKRSGEVVAPRSPKVSTRSPRLNAVRSPNLRRSSGLRNHSVPVPIPSSNDALNVLLHDFERQKQRALELTSIEHDIYKQEVAKYEQLLEKKRQENEAAVVLANSIKEREQRLARLFRDLDEKEKLYAGMEAELEQVGKEFQAELFEQEAQVAGVTSAALRMQQAANRKQLKEQWKNDPVAESRYKMLAAQDDIRDTQASINVLRKELGRLKNQASKAKSSDHRLREEQNLRENMRRSGQPRERGTYVRPKGVPKNNEKRAHMSRLEEEAKKRAAKKRATTDVADLIAQQAGVSRSRYGAASPYRNGLSSSSSIKGGVAKPQQ